MITRLIVAPTALMVGLALAPPALAQHHPHDSGRSSAQAAPRGETRGDSGSRGGGQAAPAPRQAPAPRAQAPRTESPRPAPAPRAERPQGPAYGRAVPREAPRYEAPRGRESRGYAPRAQAVPRYDGRYNGRYGYNYRYDRGRRYDYIRPHVYPYVFTSPYRFFFRPRFRMSFGIFLGYPYSYPYAYPYYPYSEYGYPGPLVVTPQMSYGGLSFQITPTDAEVWVDGAYFGRVLDFYDPAHPLTLASGRHRIDVQAPGYLPWSFDADVTPGEVIPYQGQLQPGTSAAPYGPYSDPQYGPAPYGQPPY